MNKQAYEHIVGLTLDKQAGLWGEAAKFVLKTAPGLLKGGIKGSTSAVAKASKGTSLMNMFNKGVEAMKFKKPTLTANQWNTLRTDSAALRNARTALNDARKTAVQARLARMKARHGRSANKYIKADAGYNQAMNGYRQAQGAFNAAEADRYGNYLKYNTLKYVPNTLRGATYLTGAGLMANGLIGD